MQTIRLGELSEDVRDFLTSALEGRGAVIEDDTGRARGSLIPYGGASDETIAQANAALRRLWDKTATAMQKHGVSEEDVDRLLQEDD